ncbi:MAG: OmpA family protein [Paludibacteraceae bacterium]|nr:OmpA family protein [Paludibacteraceae bacterium]
MSASLHADVKREGIHFLTTEASLGYSALLNQSTLGTSSGLAGAKLQVGYEFNYRKLLVHAGIEFASINDRARVQPFVLETPYTIGLSAGQQMIEHFEFQSFSETQYIGQINIPLQVGAWFDRRYYFLAGVRLGLPVLHSASTKAQVRTYLTDPTLIGGLGEHEEVPTHDAYTSDLRYSHAWATSPINAQVSAEVGTVLNSFFEKPQKGRNSSAARGKNAKKPILYRVALFADYGVMSCCNNSAPAVALASVSQPREITINDYYQASQTSVNSLLVGAKFAVLFQLNMPKPAKPLPSYFDIYITDAVTAKSIPASLNIRDLAKNKSVVKEAKNGHVRHRIKDGEYSITASNEQYIAQSLSASMAGEGVIDTIRFALQPKPKPVVIDTPIVSIPIKVGTKVVLHNLFFATNRTQILPESEAALDELSTFMSSNEGLVIRITGHTDNVGSDQANQILSEGRAKAVREELIKRGIAAERIEAEGKGESEPVDTNDTEEGRARNRRVEFTIISTGGADIEQIAE